MRGHVGVTSVDTIAVLKRNIIARFEIDKQKSNHCGCFYIFIVYAFVASVGRIVCAIGLSFM